jgi:hypothetical protein
MESSEVRAQTFDRDSKLPSNYVPVLPLTS